MIKTDVEQLLQKNMDRKDFLKHTGLAMLALTGFSGMLKTLIQTPTQSVAIGYSSSVYGGQKNK